MTLRVATAFKEILERCSKLSIFETRQIDDAYGELVFYNKDIDEWIKVFVDILGPAKKSRGIQPANDDLNLTKDYGGIYEDQTLFKKKYDDAVVIAMFWPWQDGTHTTLKIAFLKK